LISQLKFVQFAERKLQISISRTRMRR